MIYVPEPFCYLLFSLIALAARFLCLQKSTPISFDNVLHHRDATVVFFGTGFLVLGLTFAQVI